MVKLRQLTRGFGLALLVMTLAACQKPASKPTQQKTVTTVKKAPLTIPGKSFSGKHRGKGTAQDPDYTYALHFDKKGHFLQTITASNGYAGKFIENGTYTTKKDGSVIIQITDVTEERFLNDTALVNKEAPVSISERNTDTLNNAEKNPIKIIKKKHYLIGTVNNVKLYPTKSKPVGYAKYRDSEVAKYNDSYGHFSGHGFTSNGMDTPMNAIAFKQNKFIWTYGRAFNKTNQDVMSIFEGTYTVTGNTVTLSIGKKSPRYYGNLMFLFGKVYRDKKPAFSFDTVKLQYDQSNSSLTVMGNELDSTGMKDMHPEDTTQSYPNYDDRVQNFSAQTIDSQMHLKKDATVKEVFPTKESFIDWVMTNYEVAISEPPATDDEPGFHVLGVGGGKPVPVREEFDPETQHEITPVYVMSYSLITLDYIKQNVDFPYSIIAISDDGRIYEGHPAIYSEHLTAKYREYAESR